MNEAECEGVVSLSLREQIRVYAVDENASGSKTMPFWKNSLGDNIPDDNVFNINLNGLPQSETQYHIPSQFRFWAYERDRTAGRTQGRSWGRRLPLSKDSRCWYTRIPLRRSNTGRPPTVQLVLLWERRMKWRVWNICGIKVCQCFRVQNTLHIAEDFLSHEGRLSVTVYICHQCVQRPGLQATCACCPFIFVEI